MLGNLCECLSPRYFQTSLSLRTCLFCTLEGQGRKVCFNHIWPLAFSFIHIRLHTDGVYQNLKEKHFQIGFSITVSDRHNSSNIIHWQSSRASRRPSSTEEAELFLLDHALGSIRNLQEVVLQLQRKKVPIVLYINKQTLWCSLMSLTVTSILEVMNRCHGYIHDETITSTCLIPSEQNIADALARLRRD